MTLAAGLSLNGSQSALIGGSKTTGDVLSIIVKDAGLTGGSRTVSYTVTSLDTLATITAGIASAINNDTNLQAVSVTASASGTKLTITSVSTNPTSYSYGRSSGATETVLLGLPANGTQTAAIGGSKTTGDVLSITVHDSGLTGGFKTINYTVAVTDLSLSMVASGLAAAITADTSLQAIGVSANAVSQVVNITSASNNATFYTSSLSSGATETITLGTDLGVTQFAHNNLNELTGISAGGSVRFQGSTTNPVKSAVVNVSKIATIGGTITAGDKLWLTVHDKALNKAENVSYVVQSGDTTTSIATALKNAINANSILSGIGVSATSSGAEITLSSSSINATTFTKSLSSSATESITLNDSRSQLGVISPSFAFSANPKLASGANTAFVNAVSGGGTATTNAYPMNVRNFNSESRSYDANGNTTNVSAGIYPQYKWDAEDRFLRIDYDSSGNNHTDFTYDPLGNRVKIVEVVSGSVSSTKQFVYCGGRICEERDASGSLVKQFFALGFKEGSNSFFYNLDHLGNVREVTNSSGAIVAQISYSPWGVPTLLQGSTMPDFAFGGYYYHARSGLFLTQFRAYDAGMARWLSRDPLGEPMGTNLFSYVDNNPVGNSDPLGLFTVVNIFNWNSLFKGMRASGRFCNSPGGGDNPGGGGNNDDNPGGGPPGNDPSGGGEPSWAEKLIKYLRDRRDPRPSYRRLETPEAASRKKLQELQLKEELVSEYRRLFKRKFGRSASKSETSNFRGMLRGRNWEQIGREFMNSFYPEVEGLDIDQFIDKENW